MPMQVTLTATAKIVTLPTPDGSMPVRIWTGQTESGILVDAYIASIEPQDIANARRLEDELLETTREA
jgi:hypothetical protein